MPPTFRAHYRRDAEHRLTHDIDVWVGGASADAAPYLVTLSCDWDGKALLVATPYRWCHIPTRRVQAWWEENRLSDPDLMRDGRLAVRRLGRVTPPETAKAPPNRWRHDEHSHEDGHADA